ncbi:hypothetical protein H5410_041085 [Solanum commersonii]|uniref:Uncharacterized protein n=1 Tax=Solanum commersonii TaxID=4109 RepID=A0A9J5XQL7_SOLCO|nr:hypothetical protein H5410_041085 [Solanum commersonii]
MCGETSDDTHEAQRYESEGLVSTNTLKKAEDLLSKIRSFHTAIKIYKNLHIQYAKSDSSMRSETSDDTHEAQPYVSKAPVSKDTLKKEKNFLSKFKDKI